MPVYELFESLTQMDGEYTYDLYTALEHDRNGRNLLAVGITQCMVAADGRLASRKPQREKHFPIDLIHRGITFCCENGNASVESDKHKIIAEIGADATLLNDTIHGVVAAAAFERVLKENNDNRHEFLEAVKRSPPRELTVDLIDSTGDTQETVTAVIEALAATGASKCERLQLYSAVATEIPSCVGELTALETLHLSCWRRSSLVSLPESMGKLTALKELRLDGCSSLVSLPESIGQLTALKELWLFSCGSLVSLPESMGQLTALEKLYLGGCSSLVSLPESMGQMAALEKLDLSTCGSLVSLPESVGQMTALKDLNLGDCSSLVEVPDLPCVKICGQLKQSS